MNVSCKMIAIFQWIPQRKVSNRNEKKRKGNTKNAKNKNQFLKERKLTDSQKAKARPLHNLKKGFRLFLQYWEAFRLGGEEFSLK